MEANLELVLKEQSQTIAAIATPNGTGGIGVIRISGSQAQSIATALGVRQWVPRQASYARFCDAHGDVIDDGILVWFPAPRSFTGENVVELQVHSSPVLMQTLLQRCLQLGARLAQPGEFSQRAFLNGKLDLAQAEAIADLIAAADERAARAARRSLDGQFSKRCHAVADKLTQLRVQIEARIDFADEADDAASDASVINAFDEAEQAVRALRQNAEQGQRLRDGWHCVLVGPPNVGKSALLNALVGFERAIVTEIAGTTRDLLRERVAIKGTEVTLVDTAGLRAMTQDPIEREGIRRTQEELAHADLVLIVLDACQIEAGQQAVADVVAQVPHALWIYNKSDCLRQPLTMTMNNCVLVSALTGQGLNELITMIQGFIHSAIGEGNEGEFSARLRHLNALKRVQDHLQEGLHLFQGAQLELAAEELRLGDQAMGEITGYTYPDDLLGEIFSNFCIGK